MTHDKVCAICGKIFQATRPNAKYCGEECARDGRNIHSRALKARNREKIRAQARQRYRNKKASVVQPAPHKSLSAVAALARAQHLSYGQYMARMQMGGGQ